MPGDRVTNAAADRHEPAGCDQLVRAAQGPRKPVVPNAPHQPEQALVAVLAGGAGRRLGGAKALAQLAGIPLVCHPLRAAAAAGLQAIVIAKPDTPLPPPAALGVPVLREPRHPRHPLCGLVAALRHAAPRPVVAVGCDMPFLTAELLSWIATLPGAAIVETDGRLQPLLARHTADELVPLEAALAAERSLTATFAALPMACLSERDLDRFGDPRRLCFNVNDAADLALAERWLAAR